MSTTLFSFLIDGTIAPSPGWTCTSPATLASLSFEPFWASAPLLSAITITVFHYNGTTTTQIASTSTSSAPWTVNASVPITLSGPISLSAGDTISFQASIYPGTPGDPFAPGSARWLAAYAAAGVSVPSPPPGGFYGELSGATA